MSVVSAYTDPDFPFKSFHDFTLTALITLYRFSMEFTLMPLERSR